MADTIAACVGGPLDNQVVARPEGVTEFGADVWRNGVAGKYTLTPCGRYWNWQARGEARDRADRGAEPDR